MNRYRLNQMLEVLLFPLIDPELGQNDYLLQCYKAYDDFMTYSHLLNSDAKVRERKDNDYKKARKRLNEYLIRRCRGHVKSIDDIQMLTESYYPMREMQEQMEDLRRYNSMQNRLQKPYVSNLEEEICIIYLNKIAEIAGELITYRDGVASIRQWGNSEGKGIFGLSTTVNKIEIWNLLCRFTTPDIYIAVSAVINGLGLEALYGQKSNIALADKLLIKSLQKGVAETHLHFNVGFDYEMEWLYNMNLIFVEQRETAKWTQTEYRRLQLAVFRCLAAIYLTEGDRNNFKNWLSEGNGGIWDLMKGLYKGCYGTDVKVETLSAVQQMYHMIQNEESHHYKYDYLMDCIYARYVEYKTSSEFILLYQCYKYIKMKPYDTIFARYFVQYLRLKNEFFYNMYEQHTIQGLKYFRTKYAWTKKNAKQLMHRDKLMMEIFRSQTRVSSLKKLEIRVAPEVNGLDIELQNPVLCRSSIKGQLCSQIYAILDVYRKFIIENAIGVKEALVYWKQHGTDFFYIKNDPFIENAVNKMGLNIPTLGIVFHFIKMDYLEDISGDFCWRGYCNWNGEKNTYRIQRKLFMDYIAISLEEIRHKIPKLSEYIVGIDAASDELTMEPWMLAETYKIMRSHYHTKPVAQMKGKGEYGRIQNIGFTYHVGEDFRHIVSGLRHVDEVLEEFGFKPGDRLGHALVLGIDVEQWVDDNEVVFLSKLEYLENLLWLWGTNTREGLNLPIQLEVLEDKILQIAYSIYNQAEKISVNMLYLAYKKKFQVRYEQTAMEYIKQEKEEATYCCCENSERKCFQEWSVEKLFLTNYCPVFERKYEETQLVSVRREDIAIYQKLQSYLIQKVERMGVYVETNPTSNLTIGDFSSIKHHPIFHLYQSSLETGYKALVTINSDNPMIFNTNVENEYAYIYYAAEQRGYTKSEILEWIERIRQYGMDSSFIQMMKTPWQMLNEITDILEFIYKEHFRIEED